MTEIDKNVLNEVERNQKVEVVVKRDNPDNVSELDLVHVFVNMGKKKKIYVWVMIVCMLVGFAFPMLKSELSEKSESVSAVITFTYPNATFGTDPNGDPLDINYLSSSYILNNALRKTRLSTGVPISAIEKNMNIERLLTEQTRQDLEVVEKVINETQKDYEEVKNVEYKYENKYIITLSNGFTTDAEGKNKIFLKGNELATLLNNILSSYNEYFYETYLDMKLPESNLDSIGNNSLDYIERLDSVVEMLNNLAEYCNDESRKDYYLFRSKADGMSLKDVYDCIRLVRDIDVDYLYAYVYYKSATKDKAAMMTRYNYLLRNAQRDLEIISGNIDNNSQLIKEYKNDSITVSMQEQGTGQISSVTTDYYNSLIIDQVENYEKKADINERIANFNDKIEGFKTGNTGVDKKFVENELNLLNRICTELYNLTEKHASEIVESEFYRNSYMNYIGAQYFGSSFMSAANIKKAVIGMIVGLVIAVVIWGGDGLVEEFKRGSAENRKKKEEEVSA